MRSSRILVAGVILSGLATGQEILRDVSEPPDSDEITRFYVPYLFSSETYDTAFGFIYAETGRFQQQLSWYATALGSTNSTVQAILGLNDARLPGTERLYFDCFLSVGDYSNLRAYVDGNPGYPETSAGSNDSDPEDFIQDQALETIFRLPVRYVLPIGSGKEPVHTYWLDRGILVESSTYQEVWDPWSSGRSYVNVIPFHRRQEYDLAPEANQINTTGLTVELEYNNTDFSRNPSRGSRQVLGLTHDPGWLNSTDSWTVVEAEATKYFSFSPTENQRQRVLALEFWTADTPSWTETDTGDGVETSHRPPYFSGATLGGWRRLRAFPMDRFNDKSAILYAAEYRVIPAWHPLGRVRELDPLYLDWWQWVAFAELGRVSGSWNLADLHTDMKWDVGLGLRFMARKQIVRVDFAIGEEGWALRFDLSHPF